MARVSTDPRKYLTNAEMYIPSQEFSTIELDEMEYPNYPDNCRTLDVAKQSNETPSYIRFWFDANPEYSVEILVEDKMSALKRANAVAKFSTTGQMEAPDASNPFTPQILFTLNVLLMMY